MKNDDLLNALFGKPDYSHIVRNAALTVNVTAAEMAAIFEAYDRGFKSLDEQASHHLDTLIAKLKDEAHP